MRLNTIYKFFVLILLTIVATSCQSVDNAPRYDLVYCADQAVFSMSIAQDGKTETHKVVDLPADATCPVWSPDGKFALLYRYKQLETVFDEDSLSLIDRQSGKIHEVYQFGPRDHEWTVRWLPDGIDLILASARDQVNLKPGYAKCISDRRSLQGVICWQSLMDFYRSKISIENGLEGLERLTNSPTWRCSLEWSPDGSRLAFTHGSLCSEGVGEEGSVSVLDLNGHTVSIVIDAANYLARHRGGFDRNVPIDWSPDGERLTISGDQYDGNAHTSQVSIADIAGVRPILTQQVSWVDWLPDGKRLLWFNQGFNITDIESGKIEILPISFDTRHSIGGWVLSPDGRYLAWRETDTQDKTSQIRVFDFTNGATSTILGLKPETLKWSPDSQWLVFPVTTQLKANSCDYQIDVYVVKPDASGLRNLMSGQTMKALRCKPSTGMGWGWYNTAVQDVQWVSR